MMNWVVQKYEKTAKTIKPITLPLLAEPPAVEEPAEPGVYFW
jgi:hypothetical protein